MDGERGEGWQGRSGSWSEGGLPALMVSHLIQHTSRLRGHKVAPEFTPKVAAIWRCAQELDDPRGARVIRIPAAG